jgi:hypothetical protein
MRKEDFLQGVLRQDLGLNVIRCQFLRYREFNEV